MLLDASAEAPEFVNTPTSGTARCKDSLAARLAHYLFPGGRGRDARLSTRQYARIVGTWVASIGLDPHAYGIHSMHRTKADD